MFTFGVINFSVFTFHVFTFFVFIFGIFTFGVIWIWCFYFWNFYFRCYLNLVFLHLAIFLSAFFLSVLFTVPAKTILLAFAWRWENRRSQKPFLFVIFLSYFVGSETAWCTIIKIVSSATFFREEGFPDFFAFWIYDNCVKVYFSTYYKNCIYFVKIILFCNSTIRRRSHPLQF